jgi:hypothetical protein
MEGGDAVVVELVLAHDQNPITYFLFQNFLVFGRVGIIYSNPFRLPFFLFFWGKFQISDIYMVASTPDTKLGICCFLQHLIAHPPFWGVDI